MAIHGPSVIRAGALAAVLALVLASAVRADTVNVEPA